MTTAYLSIGGAGTGLRAVPLVRRLSAPRLPRQGAGSPGLLAEARRRVEKRVNPVTTS